MNTPAYADWTLSYPFYSEEAASAPKSQPADTPPAQAPKLNASVVQPPPVVIQTKKPEVAVPPAFQVVAAKPRLLAAFIPSIRLSSTILGEDTEWSGTVHIEGMVTVPPQTTLTVMPGSKIRFSENSGILVYGRIAVKGTPESPVYISSLFEEPRPSDWNGIFLIGTEKNNLFDHLVIQGADTAILASFSQFEASGIRIENSSTALQLTDSIVKVKNSAISTSGFGIHSVKSEVDLESVTFETNRSALSFLSSAVSAVNLRLRHNSGTAFTAEKSQLKLDRILFSFNLNGLKTTACDGSITNSRFISNREIAASLTGSNLKFSDNHISGSRVGLHIDDNNPTVWRNSISANSSYNILYLGEERLFAGGNWLGQNVAEMRELLVFSKRPGALLTAPLLAADPHPSARQDSTKATD